MRVALKCWLRCMSTSGLVLALGCGSDRDVAQIGSQQLQGPAYVMASIVYSPDGTSSFVLSTNSLSDAQALTLDQALEVGDSYTAVFADDSLSGQFFAQDSGGALTRFRVDGDGRISRSESLSFAAKGLTSLGYLRAGHVQFITPTKAYLLGNEFGEIIEWNPATLELGATIEVPELRAAADEDAEFSFNVVRRDGKLYMAYNYAGIDVESYRSRSTLVVLDPDTNTLTTDSIEGCGNLESGLITSNGDIYWSNGFPSAAVHRVRPSDAPAPCLVRVKSGESAFDHAFLRHWSELVGERPAGSLAPGGDSDSALLRVYDEAAVPIAADAESGDILSARGWRWWAVDLNALTAREISESPLDAGPTTFYEVDGQDYVIRLAENYVQTTLERVLPGAIPQATLTVPGIIQGGLVRVH